MNTNSSDQNQNNDGTPNYYGGGVPPTSSQAPQNPDWNNPYTNPNNQPVAPLPSNPYSQPYYNQAQQHGNPYSNQPYQQPYGAMAPVPTNKNAIISLVASLATLFILCGIPVLGTIAAIVGIIFGHKGLKETQEVPNSGRGIALAGTICGYAALVASLLVSAFILFVFLAAIAGEASNY